MRNSLMVALLLVLTGCAGLLGQHFADEELDVLDVTPILDMMSEAIEAADLDDDGIITGAGEWTAFFSAITSGFLELSISGAPVPAGGSS